jgi:hypothetical protein
MFNPDFYPTPTDVIERMLENVDVQDKVILEPHVGTGNLVNALKALGAKEVIGCEKDERLYKISATCCRMIGTDFLNVTSEQISHVDMIIMNPPFSSGGWHILHAWKVAPDNCKIIALCNYETIRNPYTKSRQELKSLLEMYGSVVNLDDCFLDAERKTNVEVGLVTLDKPASNYDKEFEGFFEEEDEEEEQANGLMSYNAVRDLVNRYIECVKIYDQQLETAVRLNRMMGDCFIDTDHDERGRESHAISVSVNQNNVPLKRDEFKKRLQKSGWLWIFKKMNLERVATKGLREDINKFVETQTKVPFTMRNIYKMLDIVIQTTGQRMDKAILEVFDKVTRHTHENRYSLEGFKTNSHYLVTKKFIFTYACELCYDDIHVRLERYRGDVETLIDMEKALCFITGENWDDIKGVWNLSDKLIPGEWYDTHFFRIKGFKKRTVHVEFKEEDVWAMFNQRIAKLKGYPLPESMKKTKYQKRQTNEKPVEAML